MQPSTKARGGYVYFITFTDDRSCFGYMYLMRHKSEAFENFKEFRFEVEKQTGKSIKSERRNRTLLDMVRSMMSRTELPISF